MGYWLILKLHKLLMVFHSNKLVEQKVWPKLPNAKPNGMDFTKYKRANAAWRNSEAENNYFGTKSLIDDST